MVKLILLIVLAILLSWIITILFVVSVMFILDLLNKTMSWYGRPWFIFGLYIVPVLALSGCLMFITNQKFTYLQIGSLGARSQLQAHLVRIFWTLFLLLGTVLNIRSAYVIMIPVLFSTLGFMIIHIFRLQHTVRTWQVIYVASLIIPVIFIQYSGLTIMLCFIPIAGRLGSGTNPELYIGLMSVFCSLLAVSFLTVLSNMLRRGIFYYMTLLATFLLFFVLLYTPLGFPYSGDKMSAKPQRHWIMHTQRQFYDETFNLTRKDAGIIMINMDRNSPGAISSYVNELNDTVSIEDDCDNYTFCALPLIHAKVVKKIEHSTWIPTSEPVFPANETLSLVLLSKEHINSRRIKYSVQVSGPDKLILYITPRRNVEFMNSSLSNSLIPTKLKFQGRPVYVILYQLGKGDGSLFKFDFTVQAPPGYTGPTVDLAVSGRYVHEKRMEKTAVYSNFLGQFPDWAHCIAWLAAYHSYVL